MELEKFKGFGFITYKSNKVMQEVFDNKNHMIMDKEVELKKAKSKKETSKRLEEEKKRKVFIKNIYPSMTKSKLYSINFF